MNKKLMETVKKDMVKKKAATIGDVSGEVNIQVVLKYDAETKNYELYIDNEKKYNIESTKEIGKIVEGYIEDRLHSEGLPIY